MGKRNSKQKSLKDDMDVDGEGDDFVTVANYTGNLKRGKRHGRGVYCYPNGDIYDGDWKKGKKQGWGVYTFEDRQSLVGWFYHDEYIGKEPNAKLKKHLAKKRKRNDESDPLPMSNLEVESPGSDDLNPRFVEATEPLSKDHLDAPSEVEIRRMESIRRRDFYRRKYQIPDRENGQLTEEQQRDAVRAKYNLSFRAPKSKRARSRKEGENFERKPLLMSKEQEKKEREEGRQLRENIRQKYNLPSPNS